jgi:RNA polymerase sigma-70 factor (ECF subfamily)
LIEHAELIWKAKNGDRAALESLFRLHYPALSRMAYKLAWNKAQAEDLVQETMTAAIRSFPEYRMECQFWWWLKRILHHRWVDSLRGRSFEPLPEDSEDLRNDLEAGARAGQIRKEIQALAEPIRRTAELRFLMECDVNEIAILLKIPEGTVKSRLHAAREILRKRLGRGEE